LTDFGFEKVVSQQTASAVDADHELVVDLSYDPDPDPPIATLKKARGDRREFDRAPDELDFLTAYQSALDELSSDSSDAN
jgi:hypothetical protein